MPVTDSIFDYNRNVLFVKEVNCKYFFIIIVITINDRYSSIKSIYFVEGVLFFAGI
jgi:hypothetical protein